MYDAKTVPPMEDYRRRVARAQKLEMKRDRLIAERTELWAELKTLHGPFVNVEESRERAQKRRAIHDTMRGIRFDLDQLHAEILEVWSKRY